MWRWLPRLYIFGGVTTMRGGSNSPRAIIAVSAAITTDSPSIYCAIISSSLPLPFLPIIYMKEALPPLPLGRTGDRYHNERPPLWKHVIQYSTLRKQGNGKVWPIFRPMYVCTALYAGTAFAIVYFRINGHMHVPRYARTSTYVEWILYSTKRILTP